MVYMLECHRNESLVGPGQLRFIYYSGAKEKGVGAAVWDSKGQEGN